MGISFKARLLKDLLFCRLVVRSGVDFERVLFQIFGHQAANDENLATVGNLCLDLLCLENQLLILSNATLPQLKDLKYPTS